MSLLALSAATETFPDPTSVNITIPAGTAPTGKTGFTYPNTGKVYAIVNMGSTPSNYTVVGQNGTANVGPTALTTSVPNFLGPFAPGEYNNSSGLTQVNLSSVTGITGIAVVIDPGSAGVDPLHNPFLD